MVEELSRQDLYDLVWSSPIRALAGWLVGIANAIDRSDGLRDSARGAKAAAPLKADWVPSSAQFAAVMVKRRQAFHNGSDQDLAQQALAWGAL